MTLKDSFLQSEFAKEIYDLFKKHRATLERDPVYKNGQIVYYTDTLIIDGIPIAVNLSDIFDKGGPISDKTELA